MLFLSHLLLILGLNIKSTLNEINSQWKLWLLLVLTVLLLARNLEKFLISKKEWSARLRAKDAESIYPQA